MHELVKQIGGFAKVSWAEFTVKIPGYRWRYIFNTEIDPERINGSIVDSWGSCGRTNIHPKFIDYIKSHLGRE